MSSIILKIKEFFIHQRKIEDKLIQIYIFLTAFYFIISREWNQNTSSITFFFKFQNGLEFDGQERCWMGVRGSFSLLFTYIYILLLLLSIILKNLYKIFAQVYTPNTMHQYMGRIILATCVQHSSYPSSLRLIVQFSRHSQRQIIFCLRSSTQKMAKKKKVKKTITNHSSFCKTLVFVYEKDWRGCLRVTFARLLFHFFFFF